MIVKELVELLAQVDQDRMVYTQDIDGTAQPVMCVVYLKHTNLPDGICIPDDIALMTANTFHETVTIEE